MGWGNDRFHSDRCVEYPDGSPVMATPDHHEFVAPEPRSGAASMTTALAQHMQLFDGLVGLEGQLDGLTRACIDTLARGAKILLFGNGGSASDAQHVAAELVGRFSRRRLGLAALALTADTAVLSALGNDFGFESIFARQLEALARPDDLVLGLSTSGRSPNVLAGLDLARERGWQTWALTGAAPNPIGERLGARALCVPSSLTPRIQEAHIFLAHVMCDGIDAHFADTHSDA